MVFYAPAQQRDQTRVGISPARRRTGKNSVSPSGGAKSSIVVGSNNDPLSVFGSFGWTLAERKDKNDTEIGK